MYLEHFGLSAPPFQFTASPAALFMSRTHREALAALEWGLLHEPSGLTMLIGESGVGKTTMVCALLARQYRDIRAAYLGNPKLSFTELLGSILSQLGVRGGRANKAAMINALSNFSASLPPNERIAIMVDEAQALSDDALEDFRLLSNLERGGRKAAQLVLAGQFELARRLTVTGMRHLNERIGARAVLVPLTPLESRDYVEHRLGLCGGSIETIFGRGSLELIVRESAGVPRRINALCHNSLLLAYSGGARRVTLAMARNAAADYDHFGRDAQPQRAAAGWFRLSTRSMAQVIGLAAVGIAGFASGHVLNHHPVNHPHSLITSAVAPPQTTARADAMAEIDPGIIAGSSARLSGPQQSPPPEPLPKVHLPAPPESASAPASVMTVVRAGTAVAAADTSAAVHSAPAGAPPPATKRRFVVIAPGDTLGAIALRYMGSVYAVDSLLRLNPKITDASSVYPGEVVYLPPPPLPASSTDTDETDVE
jgi:type II secretory pathway predicted ATPase ExeA/LysM repeat protein